MQLSWQKTFIAKALLRILKPILINENRPRAVLGHHDNRKFSQPLSLANPNSKATRGINPHVTLGNQYCITEPIVMSK